MKCDVAIIGGGPAGSTAAALLKKYNRDLDVVVFEKEKFPREHIGESQLPPISKVLDEMGCWDKVEAANFPIKIGVTFRWGNSDKLWDFELLPSKRFKETARPGKYEGQRKQLAFQVERSIYDKILLDHAGELGATVLQNCKVSKVLKDGDKITALELDSGEKVEASYYLDASGNAAFIRKAMGIEIDAPTKLQNVAFWDYWENAEWAFQFPGGGTRVLILSIGCGWLWYIPVGPTRTSIGFVCPADYYKKCGKSPKELYDWAISQESLIAELTANASRENEVKATKDWSFLAQRLVGENWLLVGECAGFADPILSAGMTLAQTGAREAAYTILELCRGKHDAEWLKQNYAETQARRIRQHIRFADFWYSANGIFTDLQEYTREIAREAGLELDAQKAFRWLGTGGFSDDILGQVGIGGLDLAGARQVSQVFFDDDFEWALAKNNILQLNLQGAKELDVPRYENGEITAIRCYVRDGKQLPLTGFFGIAVEVLRNQHDIASILNGMATAMQLGGLQLEDNAMKQAVQVLEVMLGEGWIIGRLDENKPRLTISTPRQGEQVHDSELNSRIVKMKLD